MADEPCVIDLLPSNDSADADREPIGRSVLFDDPSRPGLPAAFLIHNLLSPQECNLPRCEEGTFIPLPFADGLDQLCRGVIERLQKAPWKTIQWTGDISASRDCDRVEVTSDGAATTIWDRLEKSGVLDFDFVSKHSASERLFFGYVPGGAWRAKGLNDYWRMCRYNKGGQFAPHVDGHCVVDRQVRSIYTLMIYLNDSDQFLGGTTDFMDEDAWNSRKEVVVTKRVAPKAGTALCFRHDQWHLGAKLVDGQKYIMRTDVFFEMQPRTSGEPEEVKTPRRKAQELAMLSLDMEKGKNKLLAAKYWRDGEKLDWDFMQYAYHNLDKAFE